MPYRFGDVKAYVYRVGTRSQFVQNYIHEEAIVYIYKDWLTQVYGDS